MSAQDILLLIITALVAAIFIFMLVTF